MEYNEEQNKTGTGKWNFLTPDYNIGSVVGRNAKQGWNVVIKGSGNEKFIRLFINSDSTPPDDKKETNYQGEEGRQLRNAIYADIRATPYLWVFKRDTDWSSQSTEDGWLFRRLNDTYVAIRLGPNNASVEVARKGSGFGTYPSYDDFKSAVKSNAALGTNSYTTSWGASVGASDECGLNFADECDFPFDRMETDSSDGQLIDWNNDVMTVSKNGRTCTYDFNNWTYQGDC